MMSERRKTDVVRRGEAEAKMDVSDEISDIMDDKRKSGERSYFAQVRGTRKVKITRFVNRDRRYK